MAATEHFRLAREGDERVTPIELILDVVFVLAFSEITVYMVREQTWVGVADAVLFLALLWRGWFGFAWLTSVVDPDSPAVRTAIFVAMSAFVAMALIIPEILNPHPFLLYWFVAAYVVIRLVHMFLGLRASKGDQRARRAVIRTSTGGLIAAVLLTWGCVAVGSIVAAHVLWTLAVIVDYTFAFVYGRVGWRLVPGRFAERHGLIVIVALGETVLAAGAGADTADLDDPTTLMLAMVGVALLAALWGAYFDGTQTAAERALVSAPAGIEQNTLASRAYSLMHFWLVVGTVLIALGPKFTIAHPHQPFESHVSVAFFGGLGVFLLGHVGFEYLTLSRLNVARLALGLLMFSLIGFGTARPAWQSLVLAAAIMVVLVSAQRILRSRTR